MPNDFPTQYEPTPANLLHGELSVIDASGVLAAWRAGKKLITLEAYGRDLEDFASWARFSPSESAGRFLSLDGGRANAVALGYLEHLQARGLASATVNRRIASLRSMVKAARLIGAVNWALELPTPKAVPYRDTRGPGRAGFLRMVAETRKHADPIKSRNLALLWMLYGRALRRSEAIGVRFPEDVDLTGKRLRILGKHRHDREWVTIPDATIRALTDWIAIRGQDPGPLLYRLDRAGSHEGPEDRRPLTGNAVQKIIGGLGVRTGIRARPHGLRHAAITDVLDSTNGDHRRAQRFGRLKSPNVLVHYDDNREDLGGEAANIIAP
jgi:integrase/recombinase XerC